MRKITIAFITLVIITTTISCTSTKTIQKNMNLNSYSLAYIMDSEPIEMKSNNSLYIDTINFDSNLIIDTTKVIREKGWFVPLIFVNMWDSQNKCIAGKSLIQEEISDFLKESLSAEIKRSGEFKLDSKCDSAYTVELSIDKIKTEGPYHSSGFFYFAVYVYGYSYSDNAGPAISNLTISYKLKKNNKIVYSNTFSSQKMTAPIATRYNNTKLLQKDYAISMVEATSYNFKNIIEKIVLDINSYFN